MVKKLVKKLVKIFLNIFNFLSPYLLNSNIVVSEMLYYSVSEKLRDV